jgi:hypothetical protein
MKSTVLFTDYTNLHVKRTQNLLIHNIITLKAIIEYISKSEERNQNTE